MNMSYKPSQKTETNLIYITKKIPHQRYSSAKNITLYKQKACYNNIHKCNAFRETNSNKSISQSKNKNDECKSFISHLNSSYLSSISTNMDMTEKLNRKSDRKLYSNTSLYKKEEDDINLNTELKNTEILSKEIKQLELEIDDTNKIIENLTSQIESYEFIYDNIINNFLESPDSFLFDNKIQILVNDIQECDQSLFKKEIGNLVNKLCYGNKIINKKYNSEELINGEIDKSFKLFNVEFFDSNIESSHIINNFINGLSQEISNLLDNQINFDSLSVFMKYIIKINSLSKENKEKLLYLNNDLLIKFNEKKNILENLIKLNNKKEEYNYTIKNQISKPLISNSNQYRKTNYYYNKDSCSSFTNLTQRSCCSNSIHSNNFSDSFNPKQKRVKNFRTNSITSFNYTFYGRDTEDFSQTNEERQSLDTYDHLSNKRNNIQKDEAVEVDEDLEKNSFATNSKYSTSNRNSFFAIPKYKSLGTNSLNQTLHPSSFRIKEISHREKILDNTTINHDLFLPISEAFCYYKKLNVEDKIFDPLNFTFEPDELGYERGIIFKDMNNNKIILSSNYGYESKNLTVEIKSINNIYIQNKLVDIIKIFKFRKQFANNVNNKNLTKAEFNKKINKLLGLKFSQINMTLDDKIKSAYCHFFNMHIMINNQKEKIEIIFFNYNDFKSWYNWIKKQISTKIYYNSNKINVKNFIFNKLNARYSASLNKNKKESNVDNKNNNK